MANLHSIDKPMSADNPKEVLSIIAGIETLAHSVLALHADHQSALEIIERESALGMDKVADMIGPKEAS